MYRVKVRLAQLGLSDAEMKTARRNHMLSQQKKGTNRADCRNKLFICCWVSFVTFPAVSLLLSLLWYASTLTALVLKSVIISSRVLHRQKSFSTFFLK